MNWYTFFIRKIHGGSMYRVFVHAADTHDATTKLFKQVKPLVYWDFCISQNGHNLDK